MPLSSAGSSDAVIVLVVEDEFFIREDIATYLQQHGCIVLEAESGESAIEMCRSGVPVDVLVTDIRLNGCATGWDVAAAFRAARSHIPVVYASGNPIDPDRCVSGSLFFRKPYRMDEILEGCRSLARRQPFAVPRCDIGVRASAGRPI
jgi:CheY-like chemotaxis protein